MRNCPVLEEMQGVCGDRLSCEWGNRAIQGMKGKERSASEADMEERKDGR